MTKKLSSPIPTLTPVEAADRIDRLAKSAVGSPPASSQMPSRQGGLPKRLPSSIILVCGAVVTLAMNIILWLIGADWRLALAFIALPLVLVLFVFIVRLVGRLYPWTGFHGKTLWALFDEILIPGVLGILAASIAIQQIAIMQQQNNIADEQLKGGVLQNYTSLIQGLVLDKNLRQSKPGDDVRIIATTQTTLSLKQLDGERKATLLLSIYQLGLINAPDPIIDLRGADLSGADLKDATLSGANLNRANLSRVECDHTDLQGASLFEVDLSSANLRYANLTSADLRDSDLSSADLYRAVFDHTSLTGASLNSAKLTSATITSQQLAQTESLQGATMPDGSPHR